MKISKRERIILIITIIVVIGGIGSQFGVSNFFASFATTIGELGQKQQVYESYLKQLDKMPAIQKNYRSIERQFAKNSPNKSADQIFTEDIESLCNKLQLGFPRIEPPLQAIIENVDNYNEISLTVHASGDLQKIVRLLKGFNEASLIITALKISSPLDRNIMDIDVTVARITKVEPVVEEKKKGTAPQIKKIEENKQKPTFRKK